MGIILIYQWFTVIIAYHHILFIYFNFFFRGESNFHAFYYIYDGLEHDKRLKEFHLDREIRPMHSYLPSDRQDNKTKQVRIKRIIFHVIQYLNYKYLIGAFF